MPRNCTVCSHPEIDSINVDLAAKEPQRVVAERYNINPSALWRHFSNHVAAETASTILAVKEEAQDLIDSGLTRTHEVVYGMLAEHVALARGIMDKNLANGNDSMVLKAMKESRDSLALIEKFTNKVAGEAGDSEVEADFQFLTLTLRRVLPDYRDAARAIVTELKLMGALHLASTISNALILDA